MSANIVRVCVGLGEHHQESPRSKAPAWERSVLEAPSRLPSSFMYTVFTARQAEPARHLATRQSLITRCLALTLAVFPAFASGEESVDYARNVFPIFEKYCVSCHVVDEAQGGLVMESYASLMKGGDSGPAITPGVPSSSRLLMMASGKLEPAMPPDDDQNDDEGPTEAELTMIATWIEQGAKGPDGEVTMRRELNTPDIKPADSVLLPITAVALSPDSTAPDGTIRAIARYGDVRIVAGDNDLPITTIEPQPGKVNSLQFSRDGKSLLVASGVTGLYGRAAVYDVATGKLISAMEGHTDVVQIAIFSPDEKSVATASYDRQILLWDVQSAKPTQQFVGHNGAVYSLAFSPDGRVLVSGCADETVKVWDVDSGQRLDTMSQPQGEVFAVAVTGDGAFVVAGSADNRLRVWKLLSRDSSQINPLIATRFIDEASLTHVALTADGSRLVVVSESGNIKVLSTTDWSQIAVLQPLGETASDLALSSDGTTALVSLMNGELVKRALPNAEKAASSSNPNETGLTSLYLEIANRQVVEEIAARKEQKLAESTDATEPIRLLRGSEVSGTIAAANETDWFAFDARQGEVWVVETDTSGLNSKLDTIIEICDGSQNPVLQTRLQATRDSYFTFRGKNSTQNDDFRVFAWEEMKLNEYLYASGEVTRLWLAPRGSDSGFNVYPGRGNRWTYFGTSGTVHALGEPAYIVKPLADGEPPAANGLPVFDVHYANDDDSTQSRGKDSFILFKSPASGRYLVRLRDTRGEGGESFKYRLRVRPADPGFRASVAKVKAPLRRGAGRELEVSIDRVDGYDGEVIFELDSLPAGIHSNFPVRIQPGASFAIGNIWADKDAASWEGEIQPMITARAMIGGKWVEQHVGTAGTLTLIDRPQATIEIHPDKTLAADIQSSAATEPWVVKIRRGETISLVAKIDRVQDFTTQVPLGNEQAGRNMPHGVYVDNIGLNGLLVRDGESERQFFVTANPIAELGKRDFFLRGEIDGGVTTQSVQLEVLP